MLRRDSVINDGSLTLKVREDSLSQLGAVVLGNSVCGGCRDILEPGIPKTRKTHKFSRVLRIQLGDEFISSHSSHVFSTGREILIILIEDDDR